MIKWFKIKLLAQKGLSCGKTRRQSADETWQDTMDSSPIMRWLLMALTAVVVFRIGSWGSSADAYEILVLSLMAVATMIILIPLTVREIWQSNQLLLLFIGMVLINFLLNYALQIYDDEMTIGGFPIPTLLVPCALAPMLASILISSHSGFICAFLVSLLSYIFMPSTPGIFLSSLLTGFGAAYFCIRIRHRSDLIMAGVKIGGIGLICALFLSILQEMPLGDLVFQAVWAIALGVITALFVSAIMPILEWMFERITDISWLELSDLNHPLIRRLASEAPGTYHHSINVARLSEAAADTIGANSALCRACCYFHDIGKLVKPQYFIENAQVDKNPHDNLTPSMSALIIISHVKEGVSIGIKNGLRQAIIDVIREHHGNSLVYYFYKRALQQKEDALEGGKIMGIREEDIPEVEEESFRYPGPIPQSRESAIISLADAIESSSRTLQNPTTQRIEDHVKMIIDSRINDGQLEESHLTFNELSLIRISFTRTLKSMLHARIEYPKDKKEPKSKVPKELRREKKQPKDSAPQPAAKMEDQPARPEA
ncbi:MAG: HDIG domain-containing metalloprotein [Verrucomicrobiota bacterium]